MTALRVLSLYFVVWPVAAALLAGPRLSLSTGSRNPTNTLLACFLVERGNTEDIYDYDKAAGAVDLAVEWVNNYVLPTSIDLQILYVDIGNQCNGRSSVLSYAMDLWDNGKACAAYFGPGCGATAQILYDFAKFLNIPVFGLPAASVGMVAPLSDYPLLIRVSLTHSTLANVLLRFFAQFNYTTPYFLSDTSDSFYNEMGVLLASSVRAKGGAMYYSCKFVSFDSDSMTDGKIADLLTTASKSSRVILVLANANVTRWFMVNAYSLSMTKGDYVFLAVELFSSAVWGTFTWKANDVQTDQIARSAYQTLLILAIKLPSDDSLYKFWRNVKIRSKAKFNYTFSNPNQSDLVVAHFYDAVYLYATLINVMITRGLNYRDGLAMGNVANNFTFFSVPLDRKVLLDENSDRISTYVIRNMDPARGDYDDLYVFPSTFSIIQTVAKLSWPVGSDLPPNTPFCGFDGNALICQLVAGMTSRNLAAAVVVPLLAVGTGLAAAVWYFRRFIANQDDPFWWRVYISELHPVLKGEVEVQTARGQSPRFGIRKSVTVSLSGSKRLSMPVSSLERREKSSVSDRPERKTSIYTQNAPFTEAFVLNGSSVGLAQLPDPKHRISKSLIKELASLRMLHHPNIQNFVGIALNEDNLCYFIVAEVCARGSLHVLLSEMKMNLDWTFKFSLLKDLASGMTGLHANSQLQSHGNLSDATCLVDSQFVLKITDHGLATLTRSQADMLPPEEHQADRDFSRLYWRAPEFLRQNMPPTGSQKGDVYSFGIIMQQLILRSPPYKHSADDYRHHESKDDLLYTREIIMEVKRGGNPPLRPPVSPSACTQQVYQLMERCWDEEPTVRPPFSRIIGYLNKASSAMHLKSGIVDSLIRTMEQYAQTLELQVDEQMRNFMDEKRRSEQLLSLILPKQVALALTKGHKVLPETFDSTTVYFSDVDGFSDTIARIGNPRDVVQLLNSLHSVFDMVMEEYDVYKVETLNDAYVVVSGLPVRNGRRHAEQIASMSLKLVKKVGEFALGKLAGSGGICSIKLRVGMNSGAYETGGSS